MPQKSVDEKLADAKKTLADLRVIPNPPPAPQKTAPATAPKKSDYSMARAARDTGKSINYNLKQKQVANQAIDEATK